MKSLENIRTEKKVAITDLVQGVLSRRSYSRLLANETIISLDVLSKLLDKLNVPFSEFSFYMQNLIMYQNINEVYFHELIRDEKYEDAYKNHFPEIKGKIWKTLYANKTIPIGILLMKSKLMQISEKDALMQMNKIIDLKNIIQSKIINDDDVEALYLYIRLCDEDTKEKIGSFAYEALLSNEYMILSAFYEQTVSILHLIALKTLIDKQTLSNDGHARINEVAKIAVEFAQRAKLSGFDALLFSLLYQYIKINNIENQDIVFYYIASITGCLSERMINGNVFTITKEDINTFNRCLIDNDFLESPMYERLLIDGIR